jgi:hypothetical protein
MEKLSFKLSKYGYILNSRYNIERVSYKDYLREFGSDETTTGRGVAPRLYVDGNTVMTWGIRGNNHKVYAYCKNKTEAKELLHIIWEGNVLDNCDAPRFLAKKVDLYQDLAEYHQRDILTIKRYFKIQELQFEKLRLSKIKNDNRDSFTRDMMIDFIKDNEIYIKEVLIELEALKNAENKELWQIKANSLVQRVSKNDFRILRWKEIYNLIRENVK